MHAIPSLLHRPLKNTTIESELLLSNIGFAIYVIYFYCLIATLLLCLYCFRNSLRCINILYQNVSSYFNWDTVNRLFFEMFFDFALFSVLNLHTVDWQSEFPSIRTSNAVSAVALTLICATLAFYIASYFRLPRENRISVYM